MNRRPRRAEVAARAWLDDRLPLPSGRVPLADLARLLREQDREHLALARMHEQAAERARVQAQEARDLLAAMVRETGVSP